MTTRSVVAGRTRARLLAAARDRISGRWFDVTLAELAADADVSVQTLLNHFGSKQGLIAAAAESLAAEVADLRGAVRPGDVDGAVDALLRHYEVLGDLNWRFAADADPGGESGAFLDGARAQHRAWLVDVFGTRLPVDEAERDRAVTALYAATDVGTWKLIRRDLDCSVEETRDVLRRLVAGQLEEERS